jgi:hypothetical protein
MTFMVKSAKNVLFDVFSKILQDEGSKTEFYSTKYHAPQKNIVFLGDFDDYKSQCMYVRVCMFVLDSCSIPKTCVPTSRRLEKSIRVFQFC